MRLKYFNTTLILLLYEVHRTYCSNFTVSVLDGEDAMLPCILPPHLTENNTVSWSNEDDLVSEGENVTMTENNGRFSLYRPYSSDWYLRISPARMRDEGIYQCRVGDVFASAAQLIVESPPVITGYQSDKLYLQVCNTARVTLYCNVTGRPHPTIKWYKRKANDQLKYLELNTESIFIPEVSQSYAGVYLCQVSNTHGNTGMEFHISVVDLVTILNIDSASKAPRQSGIDRDATSSGNGNWRNVYSFVPHLILAKVYMCYYITE